MLAVQPLSLADALLFGPPHFPPRKHQCLRLPHGPLPSFAGSESASFTESDTAYHVTLAMPGVRTSDIRATIEERTLRLKGETKTRHRHACFDRTISLPADANMGSEGIELVHEDGVLTVSVAKRETYCRQLEVSAPEPAASAESGEASAVHDDLYRISLSVPGVRTSDIRATIEEHTLRITGEGKRHLHRMRIDRSIALPEDADVDSEEVKLVHEDGILSIAVPKRALHRKQLEIRAAGQTAAGAAPVEQPPKEAAEPSGAAHMDV